MPQYVFQDLNVRDEFVTNSTDILIYDEKVIVQSIWRLLTTQEGEIPNFRVYGLNIKKFSQYPLTKETINTIYNYVKNRIAAFEDRATVVKADVNASFENQTLSMVFYIQINNTGNIIKLPVWTIKVGRA